MELGWPVPADSQAEDNQQRERGTGSIATDCYPTSEPVSTSGNAGQQNEQCQNVGLDNRPSSFGTAPE